MNEEMVRQIRESVNMGPGPKRQLLLGSKRFTRKSAFRSTVLVMSCHLIMYVCLLKILAHFFPENLWAKQNILVVVCVAQKYLFRY